MKRNPFFHFFICFALICTLILSSIFFFIFRDREADLRNYYIQEKANNILLDFETQIESFQNMAMKLSVNDKYYYSTLAALKWNDNALLEDFKKYQYASSLTDDVFLYYNERNYIYHVSGYTTLLDVFLGSTTTAEKQTFKNALNTSEWDIQLLSLTDGLYILVPFNAGTHMKPQIALLGYHISYEELDNRFLLAGGGALSTVALYAEDQLLYCSSQEVPSENDSEVLTAVSQSHHYKLRCLPESDVFSKEYILLQFVLILLIILILLMIAWLFANSAYLPLRQLRSKYLETGDLPSDKQYRNIFEEMEYIISEALQNNIFSVNQIEQMQGMLRQQLLKQLLNGTHSADLMSYLEKMGILLPGPFFYVVSISFSENDIPETFLPELQKELEGITISDTNDHVYTVCNQTEKQIWAICSLESTKEEAELTEYIKSVAESYPYAPTFGVGNVYGSLIKLSASWLESIDNLKKACESGESSQDSYVHDSNALLWLEHTLSTGSEQDAQTKLMEYVQQLKKENLSLLMQQYIFAEFLGEISKLSRRNKIALSNQNISLLVIARDIDSFYEAALNLIQEYCENFQEQQIIREQEKAYQCVKYINENFMDYNISIELVAKIMDMSIVGVREAVVQITGKMYKDYIAFLRVEYAKKLMQEEDMSVAEICAAVGYSSVSYFIRLFKETTGSTPAKYMKKVSLKK